MVAFDSRAKTSIRFSPFVSNNLRLVLSLWHCPVFMISHKKVGVTHYHDCISQGYTGSSDFPLSKAERPSVIQKTNTSVRCFYISVNVASFVFLSYSRRVI